MFGAQGPAGDDVEVPREDAVQSVSGSHQLLAIGIVLGYFYFLEHVLMLIPGVNTIYPFLPGSHYQWIARLLGIIVLGGMGSVLGAFLGAMLVGILDAVGRASVPELAQFVLFVPMIIFLALRPQGLLGKRVAQDA